MRHIKHVLYHKINLTQQDLVLFCNYNLTSTVHVEWFFLKDKNRLLLIFAQNLCFTPAIKTLVVKMVLRLGLSKCWAPACQANKPPPKKGRNPIRLL